MGWRNDLRITDKCVSRCKKCRCNGHVCPGHLRPAQCKLLLLCDNHFLNVPLPYSNVISSKQTFDLSRRERTKRIWSWVIIIMWQSFHAVFVSRQDRWRIGVSAATLKGEGTNYTVKLQNVSYRRSGVGVVLAVSSLWARGRKPLLSTTTHGQYDARPTITSPWQWYSNIQLIQQTNTFK